MPNLKKTLFAVLTAIIIIASSTLPIFAQGPAVIESTNFAKDITAVIGMPDAPLTVRGDGSFTADMGGTATEVCFGTRTANAEIAFDSLPYPITTHRYEANGLSHKLTQFVFKTEEGALFVCSRLTVKNTNDVSVAFPTATGALPLTKTFEELSPDSEETVDYVTPLFSANAEQVLSSVTYDGAKKDMTAFWKELLSDKLTVKGLSKELSAPYKEYQRQLIYSYIGTESAHSASALASASLANEVLLQTASPDPYAFAISLMKTGNKEAAKAALSSLRATVTALKDTATASDADLEEKLDCVLALQSYEYILRQLKTDEDDPLTAELEKVRADCTSVADSVSQQISKAASALACDWEAASTDSTYGIVLDGEDFASATALYEWYINSAVFDTAPPKELYALACGCADYYLAPASPVAFINSLAFEKEDGTLVIGNGLSPSFLYDKTDITVKNFTLSTKKTVTLRITVDETNVTVTVAGDVNAPIHLKFGAFCNNIEYASTGFDSQTGTVTAPEGTSTVTVRLIDSAEKVQKEKQASCTLERSLANAYSLDSESCTLVSSGEFVSALKAAEKARTSTAEKKLDAAKKLDLAADCLSPMTAGYTHSILFEEEVIGTVTEAEVYQKFSLPSDGTVDTLTVRGRYHDGISAAVYTLRGDAYTTDELRAECYGTENGDAISFDLDFEAEGGVVYVLCIFSEEGEVTLDVAKSYDHTVHTQKLGQTVIWPGASLMLDLFVTQVNRAGLDTFYSACLEADVSGYTKESQRTLKNKLKAAKTLLCTPSVTEDEYNTVYDELKDAYDGLDTYASKEKVDEAPIVGLILIAVVVLLLSFTFISALIARKKMTDDK